jgi:hypothetical protein
MHMIGQPVAKIENLTLHVPYLFLQAQVFKVISCSSFFSYLLIEDANGEGNQRPALGISTFMGTGFSMCTEFWT